MYDIATRLHALDLLADGRSMNSVSKETGISRAAIRAWKSRLEPLPRMLPDDKVYLLQRQGCVAVTSYGRH